MSTRRFGLQLWKARASIAGMLAVFATVWAGTAQAQQPPTFRCREIIIPPGPDPDLPKIAPIFRSTTDLSEDEFDCLAWQDLIYFIWPAKAGQRGVHDRGDRVVVSSIGTLHQRLRVEHDFGSPGQRHQ